MSNSTIGKSLPIRLPFTVLYSFTRSAGNKLVYSETGQLIRGLRHGKMITRKEYFKTYEEARESFDSKLKKLSAGKHAGSIKLMFTVNGEIIDAEYRGATVVRVSKSGAAATDSVSTDQPLIPSEKGGE